MPVGEGQRDARIGDHRQVAHGEVVGDQGMRARVGDDQRLPASDDVLAERVAQRGLTRRRPVARQAAGALEELAITLDQRHERDRHPEQIDRQAREPVELRLGLGVEQPEVPQGGDPSAVADRLGGQRPGCGDE